MNWSLVKGDGTVMRFAVDLIVLGEAVDLGENGVGVLGNTPGLGTLCRPHRNHHVAMVCRDALRRPAGTIYAFVHYCLLQSLAAAFFRTTFDKLLGKHHQPDLL